MTTDVPARDSLAYFTETSYLSADNAAFIEAMYEEYLCDPKSVAPNWQAFFSNCHQPGERSHELLREALTHVVRQPKQSAMPTADCQGSVDALVSAYRRYGHLEAAINPLVSAVEKDSRLALSSVLLNDSHLTQTYQSPGARGSATLTDIINQCRTWYCGSVGWEYTHITDDVERNWVMNYIESSSPAAIDHKGLFRSICMAEIFEKILDRRYPGQKRFSLEGGESTIPFLHELNSALVCYGAKEIVYGMAHRGRLNVLVNVLGYSMSDLYAEFEGPKHGLNTSGDVKYHRGHSADISTPSGPCHVSMMFNPSHLEFVNPVVTGSVRARQVNYADQGNKAVVPILIHGDAAFAGQGIVMETLSMSETRAYGVGGTIHLVINNQVGFTTSDPRDSRSSRYCTDVAKMLNVPVVHVNGDDVQAMAFVAQFAAAYRNQFAKDVVIDCVCYRRHGHQEVDEPRATQPMMYQTIDQHPSTATLYQAQCIQSGVLLESECQNIRDEITRCYQEACTPIELSTMTNEQWLSRWNVYKHKEWTQAYCSKVDQEKLQQIGKQLYAQPEWLNCQKNVGMTLQARQKMVNGELPLDWGCAEMLAYATLIEGGVPIRFTGEDVRRGTFFHRHAAVFDQATGKAHEPLLQFASRQDQVQIFDSLLSEAGVLGFEYGYALTDPNALVIWEAQFGDFANGAQVIIDQFLAASWQKWGILSHLVMLLPHGYEGMGPEHSSARLERYLQLSAQDNIQIIVPTTPAQIFHAMRRQVLRQFRSPLIVFSPKSLLRHKQATSALTELADGAFQCLIPDASDVDVAQITRVVLCCGKVYYDLAQAREADKLTHVAIIRIEQLYPFPYEQLRELLSCYRGDCQFVWCQEEPKNQGAWHITYHRLKRVLPEGTKIHYAGREKMAAPAGGYLSAHKKEQALLVAQALGLADSH